MRVELNIKKLRNPWSAPPIATILYLGELIFALSLAIALLAISNLALSIVALLFFCGVVAWTLAEYITHRLVLHSIAATQHGNHHAHPREPINRIFWQIWLAFAVVYLITAAPVLAGVLVAYAWYLSVHHCAHHNPAILPASLLKHHLDHHKFARRNYGVTTKFWDRAFGTMLR
jgi:sterol desaturase/sphingolipid hydroxylase (fatty acid hydroxylase superfamily)